MELKRTFRSGVVLIELMASILIFALAGAVCVRVLMKADTMSTQARQLGDGVRYCSSAAELIRSGNSREGAIEALTQAWPQTQTGEETIVPLEEGQLKITQREEKGLWVYEIRWLVEEEALYSLELHRSYGEVSP